MLSRSLYFLRFFLAREIVTGLPVDQDPCFAPCVLFVRAEGENRRFGPRRMSSELRQGWIAGPGDLDDGMELDCPL